MLLLSLLLLEAFYCDGFSEENVTDDVFGEIVASDLL